VTLFLRQHKVLLGATPCTLEDVGVPAELLPQ
jgi:hypothetical protein